MIILPDFNLKRCAGSKVFYCGGLHVGLSPQTEAVLWGDGVIGAAGAGDKSVYRLFLLWDCHRRVHHHSPGDINPQKKTKKKNN